MQLSFCTPLMIAVVLIKNSGIVLHYDYAEETSKVPIGIIK